MSWSFKGGKWILYWSVFLYNDKKVRMFCNVRQTQEIYKGSLVFFLNFLFAENIKRNKISEFPISFIYTPDKICLIKHIHKPNEFGLIFHTFLLYTNVIHTIEQRSQLYRIHSLFIQGQVCGTRIARV